MILAFVIDILFVFGLFIAPILFVISIPLLIISIEGKNKKWIKKMFCCYDNFNNLF